MGSPKKSRLDGRTARWSALAGVAAIVAGLGAVAVCAACRRHQALEAWLMGMSWAAAGLALGLAFLPREQNGEE